jgi:hypothetical protein
LHIFFAGAAFYFYNRLKNMHKKSGTGLAEYFKALARILCGSNFLYKLRPM